MISPTGRRALDRLAVNEARGIREALLARRLIEWADDGHHLRLTDAGRAEAGSGDDQ